MSTVGRSEVVRVLSNVTNPAPTGSGTTNGVSEKIRAAGVNPPGTQVASSTTVGRSQVVRIPGVSEACDWWVNGAGQKTEPWPSEPRWGLLDWPAVGWPSGGCEVPRVLHWSSPVYGDPGFFSKSPCTRGTVHEWFPEDSAYPWDDDLAIMVAQESGDGVYINVNMWLSDAAGYAVSGATWFGLYRNSFLIAADSSATTEGSLSWTGTVNHLDRFHIVYQTCAASPPDGVQGAWFYMHGHRI